MAYNVLVGGEGRLQDIAAVIDRERPDAVALLEATETGASALAETLGMERVVAESNHPFPRELGICVAWLSRRPIARAEHHALPELSKTLLEIEVDGVQLFATHLASRHEAADHPREGEMRAIAHVLPVGDALLVGDLNALARGDPVGDPPPGIERRGDALPQTPREVLVPLADAGYVDCYRAVHPEEPGYTYPAETPWLRLDYVFASPRLAPTLRDCDVVRTELARRASDHLPVWANFG
jgi:endonuclease/exonuclease/phosphatase family metal-dependent hydrolase